MWYVPRELLESAGIAGRDSSASKVATMEISDAAHLNGSLIPESMRSLVALAERYLLEGQFEGVGIELGAGMGILSSTIAAGDRVEAMICVDVCENFARSVVPRVARELLGEDRAGKVIPVRGSFDHVELPDDSVDFAVEIGAFHHADDLDAVVREAARVVKPGGLILCFDRAHPDALADSEVDRMLDREYTREWLEENGYPPDRPLTRRENGEHEYRYREWLRAFESADLVLRRRVVFADDLTWRNALKAAAGFLPDRIEAGVVRRPVPRQYASAFVRRLWSRDADRFGDYIVSDAGMHGFLLSTPSSDTARQING